MYAHTVQPCTSKVQGSAVKGSITTSTVPSTRLSGFRFRVSGSYLDHFLKGYGGQEEENKGDEVTHEDMRHSGKIVV